MPSQSGSKVDYSGKLVYAMKVTQKMTMAEYDYFTQAQLQGKIPFIDKKDWKRILGDSIYNFQLNNTPALRRGIHSEKDKERDLSGKFTLLSQHFFYFGKAAVEIPGVYGSLIRNQIGHQVFEPSEQIYGLINWLESEYELNKLYGDPQLKWKINPGLEGKSKILCDQ